MTAGGGREGVLQSDAFKGGGASKAFRSTSLTAGKKTVDPNV